jgi:hypothetical protein
MMGKTDHRHTPNDGWRGYWSLYLERVYTSVVLVDPSLWDAYSNTGATKYILVMPCGLAIRAAGFKKPQKP